MKRFLSAAIAIAAIIGILFLVSAPVGGSHASGNSTESATTHEENQSGHEGS